MARRPLVFVAISLLSACGADRSPPVTNPPPPIDPVGTGHPTGAITEVAPKPAPGTALNAYRAGDGQIYRSGPGCVVYPSDGVMRPPGMMPPAVSLDCPPSMAGPEWEACIGGTIYTTEDPAVCSCFVGGNPPLPAKDIACPVHFQ